jgi:hypothetical protein
VNKAFERDPESFELEDLDPVGFAPEGRIMTAFRCSLPGIGAGGVVPLASPSLRCPPAEARDPEAEQDLDDEKAQAFQRAHVAVHHADHADNDPDNCDQQRAEGRPDEWASRLGIDFTAHTSLGHPGTLRSEAPVVITEDGGVIELKLREHPGGWLEFGYDDTEDGQEQAGR